MAHWIDTVLLTARLVFLLVATALLITSVATDYWVVTDVDRDSIHEAYVNTSDSSILQDLLENIYYLDRHKGIFKVCYQEKDSVQSNVHLNASCSSELGFGGSEENLKSFNSDKYGVRTNLLRTSLAFLIIGIVLYGVCLIWGLFAICQDAERQLQVICLLLLGATICHAFGMSVYCGVNYMEARLVELPPFPAYWKKKDTLLYKNSSVKYSWSFALGWASLGCGIIATLFFFYTVTSNTDMRLRQDQENTNGIKSMYKAYYLNADGTPRNAEERPQHRKQRPTSSFAENMAKYESRKALTRPQTVRVVSDGLRFSPYAINRF